MTKITVERGTSLNNGRVQCFETTLIVHSLFDRVSRPSSSYRTRFPFAQKRSTPLYSRSTARNTRVDEPHEPNRRPPYRRSLRALVIFRTLITVFASHENARFIVSIVVTQPSANARNDSVQRQGVTLLPRYRHPPFLRTPVRP